MKRKQDAMFATNLLAGGRFQDIIEVNNTKPTSDTHDYSSIHKVLRNLMYFSLKKIQTPTNQKVLGASFLLRLES